MTRTLLMWLWPVRMVITWKPKRWSWKVQTTNNHPHPLLLAGGFLLLSKIFLLRWKTKVRGRHLRPYFDEKQGTREPREDKDFFKSWKSRRKRESVIQNLENREEKEKLFYKILKIERRKRSSIQKSWEPRGEREMIFQNLENREENETWNFTSPAREGKPRGISFREFLEIETLVKVCLISKMLWWKAASLGSGLTWESSRPSSHCVTASMMISPLLAELLAQLKTSMLENVRWDLS